jgi:hypothetical protein
MSDVYTWHVYPVTADDEQQLLDIMAVRSQVTGETVTRSGTLRRAVRKMWEEEVNHDGE